MVYVDAAKNPYGRMLMCHMLADTPDELHAMAIKIGVSRAWYQSRSSCPHYDVAKSKRALAVALGAVEVDKHALVAVMRRIKPTWPRGALGGWA